MSPRPLMVQPMFDGLEATAFKPKDGRDRPGLYLEECSYQAARYAVEHWHYSATIAMAGRCSFGAWENGIFVGVVLFCRPATPLGHVPYGIERNEIRELARFALGNHKFPTSRIGSIALRLLKRTSPEVRIIISYADEEQRHLGVIYQAMNWIYEGPTDTSGSWVSLNGTVTHGRSIVQLYGTRSLAFLRSRVDPLAHYVSRRPKHKYSYPLDPAMRPVLDRLRKPYPTCVGSAVGGTSTNHVEGDGSSPIPTLPISPTQEVAS